MCSKAGRARWTCTQPRSPSRGNCGLCGLRYCCIFLGLCPPTACSAARHWSAWLPRADWTWISDPREDAEAESRIGGPADPGRGRALRPPLRPHYGGAHAAHRVVGARRGTPRLPPPPAPSPSFSWRRAGRRLPAAFLTAAVRARPAPVGRGRHPANGHRAAPSLPRRPRFPGPGREQGPRALAGEGRIRARPGPLRIMKSGWDWGLRPGARPLGRPRLGGGCQA